MNKASVAKRVAIISALVNGASVRATARMTGASKGTVLRLLREAGEFAECFHDHAARRLPSKRLEADEQWSFCGSKQWNAAGRTGYGDIWTFACLDRDRRFVVSWVVGERSPENATALMEDAASRTSGDMDITTDGWNGYYNAIRHAFGWQRANYAQIIKQFASELDEARRRYSPPVCTGIKKIAAIGSPDLAKASTSYIENLNLSTRQHCKRYARLTIAHSRDARNHACATSLNFFAHNYIRVHTTLSKMAGRKATPAMACGILDRPLTVADMVEMMDPKNVTIK